MTAKIGLKDVRFHAPHGFFEEEHLMGNEFSIDVEVEASIGGAAQDDDLGGTVNYATIYYLLQAEMKKPTQLLEALAYRMANRIANQFDSVSSVTLRLRKLNPPLGGKVGSAEVELTVGAGGSAPTGGFAGMPHTFEDDYGDEDYDDGLPFGRGGAPRLRGVVNRPSPAPPPPPLPTAAPPPIVFDEDAFDDEDFDEEDFDDELGDDFLSDEELAAMTAGGEDYGDMELPDDFDFDDMDFDDMDFDDFDPDEFE